MPLQRPIQAIQNTRASSRRLQRHREGIPRVRPNRDVSNLSPTHLHR